MTEAQPQPDRVNLTDWRHMTTISLNVRAIVESRSDVGSHLAKPGDAVIIQRGQPRWMMLKCPCGCREEIPINLDRRAGKAWRYYDAGAKGISLFPSVWRDTGCQSHFIIWRGVIMLFDGSSEEPSPARGTAAQADLIRRIREAWPQGGLASSVEVADALGEIPWDVMDACRQLVKEKVLVEGSGTQRGFFARR